MNFAIRLDFLNIAILVKKLNNCPPNAQHLGIWWAFGGHVVGMWWECGGHVVGIWWALVSLLDLTRTDPRLNDKYLKRLSFEYTFFFISNSVA